MLEVFSSSKFAGAYRNPCCSYTRSWFACISSACLQLHFLTGSLFRVTWSPVHESDEKHLMWFHFLEPADWFSSWSFHFSAKYSYHLRWYESKFYHKDQRQSYGEVPIVCQRICPTLHNPKSCIFEYHASSYNGNIKIIWGWNYQGCSLSILRTGLWCKTLRWRLSCSNESYVIGLLPPCTMVEISSFQHCLCFIEWGVAGSLWKPSNCVPLEGIRVEATPTSYSLPWDTTRSFSLSVWTFSTLHSVFSPSQAMSFSSYPLISDHIYSIFPSYFLLEIVFVARRYSFTSIISSWEGSKTSVWMVPKSLYLLILQLLALLVFLVNSHTVNCISGDSILLVLRQRPVFIILLKSSLQIWPIFLCDTIVMDIFKNVTRILFGSPYAANQSEAGILVFSVTVWRFVLNNLYTLGFLNVSRIDLFSLLSINLSLSFTILVVITGSSSNKHQKISKCNYGT